MDFSPDEAQQAVTRAAAGVLEGAGPPPPAQAWDWPLWHQLGQAGLLSLAVPDWLGGDGLGVLETAALLTEVGRHAAPVPALATLMTGVLPVARWGDRAAQAGVLAGVAAGDVVLTAAIREPSDPAPESPRTTVTGGSTSSSSVSGLKVGVPAAAVARWLLVPATFEGGGTGLVVVDRTGAGVSVSTGSGPAGKGAAGDGTVRLDGAPVAFVLGEPDGRAVADLYQLAVAGACAVADGAVAAALAMTTAHVGSRQQFGRPLAAFQAVAQHVADAYITARTLHLAALSGCWRLAVPPRGDDPPIPPAPPVGGLDAGSDLDVAAFWLAEHGPAALRTCHHLHGGLGMDVSYPLHRYSALVGDLVAAVGGADYALDRLGQRAGAGAGAGG